MIVNFKVSHFFIVLIALFSTYSLSVKNNNHNSDLIVERAYTNKPLKGSNNTSAYMSLTNLSDEILSINKISCSDSVSASFHKISINHKNGMINMDQIDKVVIKPKTTAHFKPGEKHVMLMGISSEITNKSEIICSIFANNEKQYQVAFKLQ